MCNQCLGSACVIPRTAQQGIMMACKCKCTCNVEQCQECYWLAPCCLRDDGAPHASAAGQRHAPPMKHRRASATWRILSVLLLSSAVDCHSVINVQAARKEARKQVLFSTLSLDLCVQGRSETDRAQIRQAACGRRTAGSAARLALAATAVAPGAAAATRGDLAGWA